MFVHICVYIYIYIYMDGTPPLPIDSVKLFGAQCLWHRGWLGCLGGSVEGLKERPLKGAFGLYTGFMRLYKGWIRVIEGIRIRDPFLGVPLLLSLNFVDFLKDSVGIGFVYRAPFFLQGCGVWGPEWPCHCQASELIFGFRV